MISYMRNISESMRPGPERFHRCDLSALLQHTLFHFQNCVPLYDWKPMAIWIPPTVSQKFTFF